MKYALCCGINTYPNPANALNGCVNDAKDWSTVLSSKFGFEVVSTFDSAVTHDAILNMLRNKIQAAVPGDIIVFTYSGHGTQVVDQNADETDGYDEALYVYDGPVVDDELRVVIDAAKPGVQIVIILDSCFSGTSTRKIGTDYMKPKFISNPLTIGRSKNTKEIPMEEMEEVLLSGCDDDEYSYDAYIGGKYNGAFTANAIPLLKTSDTYASFHTALRKVLPSSRYPQSPQLEGTQENLSRVLFSGEVSTEPPTPPPVEPPVEPPTPPTTTIGTSGSGCMFTMSMIIVALSALLYLLL